MPNYVYSGFVVTGDQSEIERFRRLMFRTVPPGDERTAGAAFSTDTILDFEGILPMPDDARRRDPEEWAVENWGTKWNAIDLDITQEAEGLLRFQFTTAWNFPTPVFKALAAEFPGLVFDGSSYEENHEFELKGQFNGDRSWGPGKIDWMIISFDGAEQQSG